MNLPEQPESEGPMESDGYGHAARGGDPPTAEQQERAKWKANERADKAEADLTAALSRVEELTRERDELSIQRDRLRGALREIVERMSALEGQEDHLPDCVQRDDDWCSCGFDKIASGLFEESLTQARSVLFDPDLLIGGPKMRTDPRLPSKARSMKRQPSPIRDELNGESVTAAELAATRSLISSTVKALEEAYPNEPHQDCEIQWAGAYDCYEAEAREPCGPCQVHQVLRSCAARLKGEA